MGNTFFKDELAEVIYNPTNVPPKEKVKNVTLKNELLHFKAETKLDSKHPQEGLKKYFDGKPFFKVEITLNDYSILGSNEYYPLRTPQIKEIELKIPNIQKKQFIELQDLYYMGFLKTIKIQKESAQFGTYDKIYLCNLIQQYFKNSNQLVLTVVPRVSDKNFQNHYYSNEQNKLRIEEYKKMSKEAILSQLNVLEKLKEKNKIITDDIIYIYDSIKDLTKIQIVTNFIHKIVFIEDKLLQADMYIQKYGFQFLTVSDNHKYILGNTIGQITKYCNTK